MVAETQRLSFWGGTACSLLPNLPFRDLLLTALMATVGAVVSFLVSLLLKWAVHRCKPDVYHKP